MSHADARWRAAAGSLLVALAVGVSPPAAAQDADREARAREHFRAGKALHGLGRHHDAVREFLLGYEAVPRPEFLFNIAQASWELGDRAQAIAYFEKYLTTAPPPDLRATAERLLAQVRQERAVPPPQAAAPPAATAPLAFPAAAPAPVDPRPAVEEPRWYRRWWTWAIAGTVVATGAAILVVALGGDDGGPPRCNSIEEGGTCP